MVIGGETDAACLADGSLFLDASFAQYDIGFPSQQNCATDSELEKDGDAFKTCHYCSKCPDGTVSFGAASSCEPCPAGRFSNEMHSECVDCEIGKASFGGVASCKSCDAEEGEFSLRTGSWSCHIAPPGHYVVKDSGGAGIGIEPCLPGTYSTGSADECSVCVGGHSSSGASSCVSTPPGFFWNETQSSDQPCPAGTHSEMGASSLDSCFPCSGPGEYSVVGSAYCSTAGAGKIPALSRDGTVDCPANTFSVGANNTCAPCPPGGHSSPGSSSCDFCGLGKEYDASLNVCNKCEPGFASLGDEKGCVPCTGEREFTGSAGSAVCELSPPGTMPNENRTGTVKCPVGTDLPNCVCPINSYLSVTKTECVKIVIEGIDGDKPGMSIESLRVMPGYWRTNLLSDDVRKCPVEIACIGWDATQSNGYCRIGHSGPLCNLCDEGFAPDAFGLCMECSKKLADVAVSATVFIIGAISVIIAYVMLNKKVFKKRPMLKKSVKTGAKILFVAFQILAALPSIIPTIELPENYKDSLKKMQVFNLDIFQIMGVGCISGGFDLYWRLLVTTLLPIVVCTALWAKRNTDAAIAVTFLVVPTVTTTIFEIFPCDKFDDGGSYLHNDYSLSCHSLSRGAWVAYGVIMLLVYPLGVLVLYSYLLINNRSKINRPVEEREKDEKLMQIMFLFDVYKPSCWWFELFETARRLLVTGVLSAIDPGSNVQLASGIVMTVGGILVYGITMPFTAMKDSFLAILTNIQLFLVMLTALVLKNNQANTSQGDSYGEEGIGILLITLNVLCVLVFFGFNFALIHSHMSDFKSDKKSTSGLALTVLKRNNSSTKSSDGKDSKFEVPPPPPGQPPPNNNVFLRPVSGDSWFTDGTEKYGKGVSIKDVHGDLKDVDAATTNPFWCNDTSNP